MSKHVGVAPSATRTTDFTSPLFVSSDSDSTDALHLVVDITSVDTTFSGGPNLAVSIRGKDLTSEKFYIILTSPLLNTVGTTVMRVGPEYTAGANIAKDYIPYAWDVSVGHSGGVPTEYSIGASWI